MISFLAPGFLKRLDAKLLVKNPILWVSKIHYVAYYSLLLWIFTSLIALIIPINLTDMVGNGIYYTLFTIISIVLLCVWLYRNSLFNIESEYGNRKKTDEYKIFFINFLCVFMLFSFAYPFSFIYNIRVANSISKEELKQEINTLNIGEPFFARNFYDYSEIQIRKDSSEVDSLSEQYPQYIYKHDISQYRGWSKYTPYRFNMDSSEISIGVLSSKEQEAAFNSIRSNDSKALEAIQKCIAIYKKHDLVFDYEPAYILERYKTLCKEPVEYDNFNSLGGNMYYDTDTYKIETILRNVTDAQYDNIFIFMWGFNVAMFYFVFFITITFMMFKGVRWQYFLITLVTFIVLPIILFIFAMLFTLGLSSDLGPVYMTGLLLLYFTALIVSFTFFFNPKKFNGFKNICMQIVYVCTPVLFFFIIVYLDETTDIFWRDYYSQMYNEQVATIDASIKAGDVSAQHLAYDIEYREHRNLLENMIWGSLIFGVLFHVSFFMVFMKEQFLKMKALPKNK
ncbi:MAG TPA: hypothetical protein VGF30_01090 [Bacteroidia bacterium]